MKTKNFSFKSAYKTTKTDIDPNYIGLSFDDSNYEFIEQLWYIEQLQDGNINLHLVRDDLEGNPFPLIKNRSDLYVKSLIHTNGCIMLRFQGIHGVVYVDLNKFVGVLDGSTVSGWYDVNEFDELNQSNFLVMLSGDDAMESRNVVSDIYVFSPPCPVPRHLGFTNKLAEGAVFQ